MCVATVFGLSTRARGDLPLGLAACEQAEDLALTGAQAEVVVPFPVPVPVAVRGCRTSQRAPDARQKLAEVERLHEIVVGAEHEAGRAIERSRALGGDEDDRKVVAESLVELAKYFETAQCAGKLDLDYRERWTVAVESFEEELGVLDGSRFIPQAHSDAHRR